MNLLLHTYDKLILFGARQNEMLSYLMSPNINMADDFTRGAIVKMFRMLTPTTTAYDLTTVIRCVESLALLHTTPVIFIVNQGEDFAFEVRLEAGKSFVGYTLQAYNAQTGLALGPGIAGTSAPTQDVPVLNLPFAAGRTYRVHVVLQKTTPSNVLLTEAFVIVEDTIDYIV